MNETEFVTELLNSIMYNIDDETLKRTLYKDLISLLIEFSPETLQDVLELDPVLEEEYTLFIDQNWETVEDEDEEKDEDE